MELRRSLIGDEVLLIVEDDRAVRTVVRDVLELFGYTVYAAEDGATALRTLGYMHPEPDLILTDLVLPEVSGLQVIEELVDAGSRTPVLMMSGCVDEPPASYKNVEIPFIAKPFGPEALARRIREVLDSHQTAA